MNKDLKVLKAQKTKLLNKVCETEEQFEEVQNKLNQIELEIMIAQNENHIPSIN